MSYQKFKKMVHYNLRLLVLSSAFDADLVSMKPNVSDAFRIPSPLKSKDRLKLLQPFVQRFEG